MNSDVPLRPCEALADELFATVGKGDTSLLLQCLQQQNPALTNYIICCRDKDERTLLHAAAAAANAAAIDLLLAHKADPAAVDESSMTPLHICCAVGCTGGAAAILQYIGNPAAAAATAAAAAAAGAHAAGDAAVAADAAVGKAQNAAAAGAAEDAAAAAAEDAAAAAAAEAAATAAAAAAAAAADEDKPSIKDAINSVTQSGGTPLLYAASKGHLDIVKLLLQHGADVNRKGFGNHTAICRAITAGRKSVVQFLLDVPGIDLTVKETGSADNLLHLAVNSGYADIYWDIADRAPELEDQKNNDGYTPVGMASSYFMKELEQEFKRRKEEKNTEKE